MKLAANARRFVRQFIETPMAENASYSEIANELSQRKDVILDGVDVNDKESSKKFIIQFAYRHGMK